MWGADTVTESEACLTDANIKRVLDELEPKIKLFKEKTDD